MGCPAIAIAICAGVGGDEGCVDGAVVGEVVAVSARANEAVASAAGFAMGGCRGEEGDLSVERPDTRGSAAGRLWRGLRLRRWRLLLARGWIVGLSSQNVIEDGLLLLDESLVEIVVRCETVGPGTEPALLVEGLLELALSDDADGGHGFVVLAGDVVAAVCVDEALAKFVVAVALGVDDHGAEAVLDLLAEGVLPCGIGLDVGVLLLVGGEGRGADEGMGGVVFGRRDVDEVWHCGGNGCHQAGGEELCDVPRGKWKGS